MLEVTGTVVGAFPFSRYEEKKIQLASGDVLVAYTDGMIEPENEYGEMFGEQRLTDLLAKNVDRDSPEIIARMMEAVLQWTRRRRRIVGRYDHAGGEAPMKVLTAAQMREVDRRTIEMGIPGLVLMENAGHRVVELLAEKFAPLAAQRIVVLCGKGNNGGDGMVVARQLFTRFQPRALHVVLLAAPEDLKGDAAQNYRMLQGLRLPRRARNPGGRAPRDASWWTRCWAPASAGRPPARCWTAFARSTAVFRWPKWWPWISRRACPAIPASRWASRRARITPSPSPRPNRPTRWRRIAMPWASCAWPPSAARRQLYDDGRFHLAVAGRSRPCSRQVLAPRPRAGHKGTFGHVLAIAGSHGKTGAAAMCGMAALRAGAGLVTVASEESAIPVIAGHAAELMTEPLSTDRLCRLVAENKDVIAIGPGLGTDPETVAMVRRAFAEFAQPMVVDADALNALAGTDWSGGGKLRVLTPHPGEMARLCGKTTAEISADRLAAARGLATERQVTLVLKGERTLIAFPDGRVWINPTGTPAMGTGGTGDILTGLIAGLLGQFPKQPRSRPSPPPSTCTDCPANWAPPHSPKSA